MNWDKRSWLALRRTRHEGEVSDVLQAAGPPVMRLDATVTDLTRRLARWETRHPWRYGLTAFFVGGAVISLFIMTGYKQWAFESIDLASALHRVIFGGLLGGAVSAALAIGYARMAGKTTRLQQ